jgi:hypothetical protein
MQDLWWTKWHWDKFFPITSVSPSVSSINIPYTFVHPPTILAIDNAVKEHINIISKSVLIKYTTGNC